MLAHLERGLPHLSELARARRFGFRRVRLARRESDRLAAADGLVALRMMVKRARARSGQRGGSRGRGRGRTRCGYRAGAGAGSLLPPPTNDMTAPKARERPTRTRTRVPHPARDPPGFTAHVCPGIPTAAPSHWLEPAGPTIARLLGLAGSTRRSAVALRERLADPRDHRAERNLVGGPPGYLHVENERANLEALPAVRGVRCRPVGAQDEAARRKTARQERPAAAPLPDAHGGTRGRGR